MSRLTNRAFFRAQSQPDPDAGLGPIGCESAPNFGFDPYLAPKSDPSQWLFSFVGATTSVAMQLQLENSLR